MFWIIGIIVIVGAITWLTYVYDKSKGFRWPWLTAIIRALLFAIPLLLLLNWQLNRYDQLEIKPQLLVLMDNSKSIQHLIDSNESAYQPKEWINTIQSELGNQFDIQAILWGESARPFTDTSVLLTDGASDLTEALQYAEQWMNEDDHNFLLLLTDGHYNKGIHPIAWSNPAQAVLHTVVLGDTISSQDVAITEVNCHTNLSLNSQFGIETTIKAQNIPKASVQLQLLWDGQKRLIKTLQLNDQTRVLQETFEWTAEAEGWHKLTIAISPLDGERIIANNTYDKWVYVQAKRLQVLMVDNNFSHPDIGLWKGVLSDLEHVQLQTSRNSTTVNANVDAAIVVQPTSQDLAMFDKTQMLILPYGLGNLSQVGLQPNKLHYKTMEWNGQLSWSPAELNLISKLPPLYAHYAFNKSAMEPIWLDDVGNVVYGHLRSKPHWTILNVEGFWRWQLHEQRHSSHLNVTRTVLKNAIDRLLKHTKRNELLLSTSKDAYHIGEAVEVYATLYDALGQNIHVDKLEASLEGMGQTKLFEKTQSGYKLTWDGLDTGDYLLYAQTTLEGKAVKATLKFSVKPFDLEALQSGADWQLLAQLSQKNQGVVVHEKTWTSVLTQLKNHPKAKTIMKENRLKQKALIDYWYWALLLLLLATADWYIRKYWHLMR